MGNPPFTEYLKNVVDLEKAKYVEERTIYEMEYRIQKLGRQNGYTCPSEPKLCYDILGKEAFGIAGSFALFGFVIGIFLLNILKYTAIGFFLGIAFSIVIECIDNHHNNRIEKEYYEKEMKTYNRNVTADRIRIERENREKEHLSAILCQLKDEHQITSRTLERYYSIDLIYPKYRNLVAMCSIYEYFQSGRCDALTGHEGAYNIYESEVRFGMILTKLEDIGTKLDRIKENQSILYYAIDHGNRISENLLNESTRQSQQLQMIEDHTAVAAYCSERAAREANQIKWLQLYNSLL